MSMKDMEKMKKLLDVSCDKGGAIETSIPTTIENPTYFVDGVLHYVVDHTPSLMFYSASKAFGDVLVNYIDEILEDKSYLKDTVENATIIKDGVIIAIN